VSGFDEIGRHRAAHDSESKKCDFHRNKGTRPSANGAS
jgi:hypothetical protein